MGRIRSESQFFQVTDRLVATDVFSAGDSEDDDEQEEEDDKRKDEEDDKEYEDDGYSE